MHTSEKHPKMTPPTQDPDLTETSPKHSHTSDAICDLDDPYLVPKFLSQAPRAPGTITCRFLALPLNESDSFTKNMAQYGQIVHESRTKLIICVSPDNVVFMDRIRLAWVSKYLTPFTECVISFDLPKWDRTTTVIIQQVPAIPNNRSTDGQDSSLVGVGGDAADDLCAPASEASMRDSRVAVRFSRPSEKEDAVPRRIRRRRAISLPCPGVFAELREPRKGYWYRPRLL